MRKVLSGLLLASALGVSAAPAVAIEGPVCLQNNIQAGCTYCSYNGGNTWSSGCRPNGQSLPGHETRLCVLWLEDHCEVIAPQAG